MKKNWRTALKDTVFSAHDELIFIPKIAVVMDMRRLIHRVEENPVLSIVAGTIGLHNLISEVAWDGFYGRASNHLEFFYMQQEDFEDTCGLSADDIYTPFSELEEYVGMEFFKHLPRYVRDEFNDFGFVVKSWISPTDAILESTSGKELPRSHPAAEKRVRSEEALVYHF